MADPEERLILRESFIAYTATAGENVGVAS